MALKLKPDPTFKAKADIPVPGAEPAKVEFEFKHRTQDELAEFNKLPPRPDIDVVMEVIVGWELTDEFSRANVELLLQSYYGAANAIQLAYVKELYGARLGN